MFTSVVSNARDGPARLDVAVGGKVTLTYKLDGVEACSTSAISVPTFPAADWADRSETLDATWAFPGTTRGSSIVSSPHSTMAPPLKLAIVPVIALAWSDTRNVAVLASSASVVRRLRCVMLSRRARNSAYVTPAAFA